MNRLSGMLYFHPVLTCELLIGGVRGFQDGLEREREGGGGYEDANIRADTQLMFPVCEGGRPYRK